MRIAFCHHLSLSYYAGGEKFLIALSNELSNRGHDIVIYALPFLLDGYRKIDPYRLLDSKISYEEVLYKKVEADVSYITYNPFSWLYFRSNPKIAAIHSQVYWNTTNLQYGIIPNLAYFGNKLSPLRLELRRFDAVHAVTSAYSIPHKKVYFIPNFIDSKYFKPSKKKEENFTIVFASRMVWQKGWDTFQKIMKMISDSESNLDFLISAGKIPEKEFPRYLSQAHVTIVPSRVDLCSLGIVESMLCGTPVITTSLRTHKELCLPLIYADHPNSIVLAIKELKKMWESHREKYLELSKICRESAIRYDKKFIIDRLEKMFMEVGGCQKKK